MKRSPPPTRRPDLVLAALLTLAACGSAGNDALVGSWSAALDLAGGELPFMLHLERDATGYTGRLCNGPGCQPLSAITLTGDTLRLEIGDYDATVTATLTGDSLIGDYRNVGNRGPRVIPFRATRGTETVQPGPEALLGRWDATFITDTRRSPRVFEIRNGATGLEGNVLANSGDYGIFHGAAVGDSFFLAKFDGAFVYLAAGRLDGDTLRGTFHAGLRTQTPFVAVRSTGARHLTPPNELTRADTLTPFTFAFPDLEGRIVTQDDPRFRGKVVMVDIFGSWCPTCHDAAPTLVEFHRDYHDRGLAVLGLAYEVTGDTAVDHRQLRRYRDKFGIEFPLLLGGINDVEATAATLPQLEGFTAYPTTLFLGRDGRIREIHAGFLGPGTGAQYTRQIEDLRATVERLLAENNRE